uniref:Uncharacterized protein n=1 Tax=Nonomuraea gerenzanensis TaxID=93944 RepID=A0A1M4E538_9ACTN|nr:hypothetical protein BN4615_P3408 [Nonomuraea gerenzanensis]
MAWHRPGRAGHPHGGPGAHPGGEPSGEPRAQCCSACGAQERTPCPSTRHEIPRGRSCCCGHRGRYRALRPVTGPTSVALIN